MWRTHSCVPCRDSSRHPFAAKGKLRRHECRRGTLGCVRHAVASIVVLAVGLLSAQTTRSVWDGVYASEQAERGAELYANNCASCHGSALGGGESAPPLTGGEFSSNWNGLTLGDLFERIRTTMPADRPGRLTREQDADVVAYMLSVSEFPAGNVELARQTEVLKQIQYDSTKPDQKK
ncbi:MAG: c-type cytochrome [Acidobacteriia bacterium]|nr:c-type cytochrome [Terriglobia bacterium]